MKASAVIRETKLPSRWVHRVARRRAKRAYHGEDDPCETEPCPWCEALRWILHNAEQVRAEEAAADHQARLKRNHARTVASVTWKQDNHDLFDFLEGMLAGDFRDAALRAVDNGTVSPTMEAAVRAAARKQPKPPPAVGAWVDVVADVLEAREMADRRGAPILRLEFMTDDKWRGRVELSDPSTLRVWRGVKPGTSFAVGGRVVWRVERMAIIEAVGGLSPVQR